MKRDAERIDGIERFECAGACCGGYALEVIAPASTSLSATDRMLRRRTHRAARARWRAERARPRRLRCGRRGRDACRAPPARSRRASAHSVSSAATTASASRTPHPRAWPCCCVRAQRRRTHARKPTVRAPTRSWRASIGNCEQRLAEPPRGSLRRLGSGSDARGCPPQSVAYQAPPGLPACACVRHVRR